MTFLSPRKIAVRLLACAGVCLLGMAPLLGQTSVSLPAAHDATIFFNSPTDIDRGAGGAPGIFAGSNSATTPRRGLISFDLSSIPTNATITSVQLQLHVGMIAGSGGTPDPLGNYFEPTIGLHRMLIDWGEQNSQSLPTQPTLGGTGQGATAEPGDATWNQRYAGQSGTEWDGGQPGVHFNSDASSSLFFPYPEYTLNSEALWLSTPALVADVQGWVANSATNNGWMLLNTTEDAGQTFRAFYSRNYMTGATDPAQYEVLRPQLLVTYAIPEPTTVGLVVMCVGLTLWQRRTRST